MTLYFTLFLAGMLTILLPCILPLVPIVVGASVAGRSPWRPLCAVGGMVVSFLAFTFLLFIVLAQFVTLADVLRVATYDALLLFGAGFLTERRVVRFGVSALGGYFFIRWGFVGVATGAIVGIVAMALGGRIATWIQQQGADAQAKAREQFGADRPLTAFLVGLTMGLVWVPCAGPGLGFAFALVRDEPGLRAFLALLAYALGTAVPLLLVGYGGQFAVHSARSLTRFSGAAKHVAGALLLLTALGLQYQWIIAFETFLAEHTSYGSLATDWEERLFQQQPPPELPTGEVDAGQFASVSVSSNGGASSTASVPTSAAALSSTVAVSAFSSSASMVQRNIAPQPSDLPKISRAPTELPGGPWHNSQPLRLGDLKGKVVLIDFWTYSCINCIRTLPYIRGYWDKYKDAPFVLIGVHTPEFVFEKDQKNVADAIEKYKLTYPIVQDNDFTIWRSFANRYWPAKYLIDADGYIRYTHFGEGDYEETDAAIASLLKEIGVDVEGGAMPTESDAERRTITPETYLGERSWPSLANGESQPVDTVETYRMPESLALHQYALDGMWQLTDDGERQTLRSDAGDIRLHFLGGECNIVLGRPESGTATMEVIVDGKTTQTITVDANDLYQVYDGEYGDHDILLRFRGAGVGAYAFTFGS